MRACLIAGDGLGLQWSERSNDKAGEKQAVRVNAPKRGGNERYWFHFFGVVRDYGITFSSEAGVA